MVHNQRRTRKSVARIEAVYSTTGAGAALMAGHGGNLPPQAQTWEQCTPAWVLVRTSSCTVVRRTSPLAQAINDSTNGVGALTAAGPGENGTWRWCDAPINGAQALTSNLSTSENMFAFETVGPCEHMRPRAQNGQEGCCGCFTHGRVQGNRFHAT